MKHHARTSVFLAWLLLLTTTGCSAVKSRPWADGFLGVDGLTYYLPKRDVRVTLTVADGGRSLAVAPTDAYADTDQRYVASFSPSHVGSKELTIGVGANGLLSSTTSKATSKVGEILSNLARAAGMMGWLSLDGVSKAPDCADKGTYTTTFTLEELQTSVPAKRFCGLQLSAKLIGTAPLAATPAASWWRSSWRNGLYYRQSLAYEVTALESETVAYRFLVALPNQAPAEFLPLAAGVFGNQTSALAFEQGSPTSYGQTVDGEVVALAKIPADVIKAYFEGIGAMFTSQQGALTAETSFEQAVAALAVQQAKTDACLRAIATGDAAKQAEACK